METQQSKSKPIETQTLASEQSSIQDDVTQLKSVITKTIENNNENVKEVEQELEKIANERKAATEKVILTDAFDTRNDFEPIVETFSEDDAIVIKPKQTIDEHPAEAQETDYIIEDNTVKNGKLATVDIDNERQRAAFTVANKPNEPNFTAMEFDDSKINNKGFDDVTIGLETAKVRSCISIQSTHFFSVIAPATGKIPPLFFRFISFVFFVSSLVWSISHTKFLPFLLSAPKFIAPLLYRRFKHFGTHTHNLNLSFP